MWALYTVIVRPLLNYRAQCWTPFLTKDIDQLEKVQHKARKLYIVSVPLMLAYSILICLDALGLYLALF